MELDLSELAEFLYNEYKVDVEESDEWQFTAWYAGDGQIYINQKFQDASGLNLQRYLAHEIAHSAAESLYLPTWFDEGIARYSERKFLGTDATLYNRWFDGFEAWDPNNATYANNIKGYDHAAYVVKTFIETYGVEAFKALLIELDGVIGYSDDTDAKNQKVLSAIRTVTGNSTLSLEDVTILI